MIEIEEELSKMFRKNTFVSFRSSSTRLRSMAYRMACTSNFHIHLIFNQIVLRTLLDCPHCHPIIIGDRQHDDWHTRCLRVHPVEVSIPGCPAFEIQQDYIDLPRAQALQPLREPSGATPPQIERPQSYPALSVLFRRIRDCPRSTKTLIISEF